MIRRAETRGHEVRLTEGRKTQIRSECLKHFGQLVEKLRQHPPASKESDSSIWSAAAGERDPSTGEIVRFRKVWKMEEQSLWRPIRDLLRASHTIAWWAYRARNSAILPAWPVHAKRGATAYSGESE